MSELTREIAVRVHGTPVPQGSMTCVGFGGQHNVQPSNRKALKAWRDLVKLAGEALPVTGLVGPVGVEVTFTIRRPESHYRTGRNAHLLKDTSPLWPITKNTGDDDKLARAVLDGLTISKVYGDDAQVVELVARKCYPDTPGATDRLDRPGALIRIYPIGA